VSKRVTLALVLFGCTGEVAVPSRPDGVEPTAAEPPTAEPVLAWGFEPASADCNGWPVAGALAIRAAPPHSGAYSCKVCTTDTAPELRLSRTIGNVPAGRYVLTAWVRKRVATAAPENAIARIEASTAAGDIVAVAPLVSVREEWDKLEVTLDLAENAEALRVTIGAEGAEPDRCLLVDDVTVSRQSSRAE
jgi:hypothetical protein